MKLSDLRDDARDGIFSGSKMDVQSCPRCGSEWQLEEGQRLQVDDKRRCALCPDKHGGWRLFQANVNFDWHRCSFVKCSVLPVFRKRDRYACMKHSLEDEWLDLASPDRDCRFYNCSRVGEQEDDEGRHWCGHHIEGHQKKGRRPPNTAESNGWQAKDHLGHEWVGLCDNGGCTDWATYGSGERRSCRKHAEARTARGRGRR